MCTYVLHKLISIDISEYVCTYIHICIYIQHIHIYLHICLCINMYTSIYVYVYIKMHTYPLLIWKYTIHNIMLGLDDGEIFCFL